MLSAIARVVLINELINLKIRHTTTATRELKKKKRAITIKAFTLNEDKKGAGTIR